MRSIHERNAILMLYSRCASIVAPFHWVLRGEINKPRMEKCVKGQKMGLRRFLYCVGLQKERKLDGSSMTTERINRSLLLKNL